MSRNITDLHPKLQKTITTFLEECKQQGLQVKITDCYRDEKEQADCVARKTSTLRYPKSHHNWGTAFDFCRNDGKGAFNEEGGFFEKVGKIGVSLGLIWGGNWKKKDKPHLQMSEWGTGTSTLIAKYQTPKQFQSTWSNSNTNSNNSKIPPTIRFGSRGSAVKMLQEKLNQKGYSCGVADEIFGRKTEQGVLNFQESNHLVKDGIVGKNTWSKLLDL